MEAVAEYQNWIYWGCGVLLVIGLIVRSLRKQGESERRILFALDAKLENEKMYGLDLVKRGAGKRGGIYVTLARMEEDGYLTSAEEEPEADPMFGGRFPRRHYAITRKGREHLSRLSAH